MNATKQGNHRRRKAMPKAVAGVDKVVKETFDEAAAEPVPVQLADGAKQLGRLIRQKGKGATATVRSRHR